MKNAILESAVFALKADVTREAFVETIDGMSIWAAEQSGFVSGSCSKLPTADGSTSFAGPRSKTR
jgi:hypothetical protein